LPDVVVYIYNPSIYEAEEGGLLEASLDYITTNALSQNKTKQKIPRFCCKDDSF
jgi:hypothetical protein